MDQGFDFGQVSPFDAVLGTWVKEASPDRVVATIKVTPALLQPHGILHGGVYASFVESVASLGASLWLGDRGRAVGVSNATDFLRPVSGGELQAEGTPLSRGRTLQLWQVAVTDEQGRLVAHGRVRLMNLPADGGPPGRAAGQGPEGGERAG